MIKIKFSGIMMYYMIQMSTSDHQHRDNCCIVPGLSLENMLLFILSTPVQVQWGLYFFPLIVSTIYITGKP